MTIGTKVIVLAGLLSAGFFVPVNAQQQNPAIAVRANGEADVVLQGPNNSLLYFHATPGSPWIVDQIASADTAFSSPAIAVRPNGEADVAVQGPDHSLLYFHATPGSPWAVDTIASFGTTFSSPAISVRAPNGNPPNEADVVAQGPNNTLWYYHAAPGQPWSAAEIPGDGAVSSPAIAVRSNGEADITVQGPVNTLWYYHATPGQQWVPLQIPGASAFSSPAIAVRDSNGNPPNEADIVVQGPTNSLLYYHATPGQPWVAARIAGTGTAAVRPAFSSPGIAVRSNGEADLVVQGPDDSLWYYHATPGQQWVPTQIPGPGATSAPAIAVRAANGNPPNEADVVALSRQNLFYYWATPGAAWQQANLGDVIHAQQASEWPMYRRDMYRDGDQSGAVPMFRLNTPPAVKALHVVWAFPNEQLRGPALQNFVASPVVSNGVAYIGNPNGEFYAFDMKTGMLKWMFPDPNKPSDGPPLLGKCQRWGQYGIKAAAAIFDIEGELAVIFGAPDPDLKTDNGNGSARLWARDAADGHKIWTSDVVARVTGCTQGAFPLIGPPNTPRPEYHETIKYSAPLPVLSNPSPPNEPGGGGVYVGVESEEDPIQLGAVREVDLWNGKLGSTFRAGPGATVGGDVWNGPASDGSAIFFTTGNARFWNAPANPTSIPCFDNITHQPVGAGDTTSGAGTSCTIPHPFYYLSLVGTDFGLGVKSVFQPLPINLDQDPDWNAGATVMHTSCGELVASVMKDGWAYAVVSHGTTAPFTAFWQFPDEGLAPSFQFPPSGAPVPQFIHGENGFRVPGAAWGDVLVVSSGGYALPRGASPTEPDVLGRLYAVNACMPSSSRRTWPSVRWLINPVPNTTSGVEDSISAPTVIDGLIYIATKQGHLMVYADPSVVPAAGKTCSDTTTSSCTIADMVQVPAQLIDIPLPDQGDAVQFRKEVVLAENVALVTGNQHVYAYGSSLEQPKQ